MHNKVTITRTPNLTIEKGIPLPTKGGTRSYTREIINQMKSGDSFLVNNRQERLRFASMFNLMPIKYVSRDMQDGTFRIWRA